MNRNEIIDFLYEAHCRSDYSIEQLADIIAPDERPQGEWILMKENRSVNMYRSGELVSNYKCSLCGRCISTTISRLTDYPFCHCGADMRNKNTENI